MTDALDGALAALDQAAKDTRRALRGAVLDLDSVALAPAAVAAVLALARTLSQAIGKLAPAAAGHAAPAPAPAPDALDLLAVRRVRDLLAGRVERCPRCGGVRAPGAAQERGEP